MRTFAGHASRVGAVGTLIVGGVLAFAASFLPLVREDYPALPQYHEPATSFVIVPGQTLVTFLGVQAHHPLAVDPSICLLFVAEWGAPLLLAAIGLWLWMARSRAWRARVWASGSLLIMLGAGFTILSCAFYLLVAHAGVIQPRVALSYGPAVSLFGYLLALVGVIWVARLHAAPTYRGSG